MNIEQILARINSLSESERQKILDGISLEAAETLKKVFPEWWFLDTLLFYKRSA